MEIVKKYLAGLVALSLILCLSAPAQAAAVLVDSYVNETGPLGTAGNIEAEFRMGDGAGSGWEAGIWDVSQSSSTLEGSINSAIPTYTSVSFSFGYSDGTFTLTLGNTTSTFEYSSNSTFSSIFFGVTSSNTTDFTNYLHLATVSLDGVDQGLSGSTYTGSGIGTLSGKDLTEYFKEYSFTTEDGEPLIFSEFEITGYLEMYGEATGTELTAHVGVSATPIPAAAWLLGTGLLGLIGIRRKSMV